MSLRAALRRLWLGLATLAGIRRGWFIPYRYAERLPGPGARQPYAQIEAALHAAEPTFAATLERVEDVARDLEAIGDNDPAPGPRWSQDWFPRLDAAVAYAMVRAAKPRVIVEVGSGHSTRFLARAVYDGGLATTITAIDPAPRAAIEGLGVDIVRSPLDRADPALFAAIGPGDMLFVDSSHVLMPGSDVDELMSRIVPALPRDALLHVHDVFLPDDYPESWAWRGYNEQLAVMPLVTTGAWQPLFASHYVASRHPENVGMGVLGRLPLLPGAKETSLWLRRR